MRISQKQFNKTRRQFNSIEDVRNDFWYKCRALLDDGYEVEAYIMLLATWNFARFRYTMKNLKLIDFVKTLRKISPALSKLKNKTFKNVDLSDSKLQKDIKFIYGELKNQVEQTGASKIMALKNHNLFIMWDTEIRKIYKIPNKAEPEHYISFLIKMREIFGNIKLESKDGPLAKAIDEYNYVLAEKRRRNK